MFFPGCSAMRDNVDCLLPDPPLDHVNDVVEEVKLAQNVPVFNPPEIEVDHTLSLSDILGISLQLQLKSARALAAARSLGYSYKSSLKDYYPSIHGEIIPLIDDLHIDPPGSIPPTFIGVAPPSTSGSSTNGTFKSLTETITLSYLLIDFGGRDAAAAAAWHDFQSSGYLYNQSVQTVLIDSLQAYYNYMNAFESRLAAIENLKTANNSYEVVKGLFEAKYATVLDLEQLEVTLLQNEIVLRGYEGSEQVEHGALANAMGIKTSLPFKVEELSLDIFPVELADNIEELMHAALVLRPSLASYKEEYLKRRSEIVVAKSAGLPKLFLEASSAHTRFYNGPTRTINESTISLNLKVPIFEGFYFTNQLRKSKADRDFACIDWRLNEEAVMLDVWSNYYHFLTAKDNLETAKKLLKASTSAYDAAIELYRLRYASIQDLLNAQGDLASSRLLIVQTKINMASSISNLAYSIGILTPNHVVHCNE